MDDLLPEEVVESTDATTVDELSKIVNQIKQQLEDAVSKFETLSKDLTERIELLESDFKQVALALQKAGQIANQQPTVPTTPSVPSGAPPSGPSPGGPRPAPGGPRPATGGPRPPKL